MKNIDGEFSKVVSAFPDEFPHENSGKALGIGDAGIVAAHDDIVTKFYFRPENSDAEKKRITEFHREVFLLRSFQDHGLDNIEVPTLIGTPEELDHQDFMARYSMTIVGGSSLPKIKPEHLSKDLYQDRYKSAGALLARFHSSTQNMDLGKPVGIDLSDTTEILPVDAMTSETNEKLRRANAYLQSNMAKGIAHGNFTITNIMGEQDAATGLIDFAHTGNAENIYADFMGVPSEYLEYAIQGYEEESGKSVRYDVYATILALHTNNFSHIPTDRPDIKQLLETEIVDFLDKMEPVIG